MRELERITEARQDQKKKNNIPGKKKAPLQRSMYEKQNILL